MQNPKMQESVETLGRTLATTLARLHGINLYAEPAERRHDPGRLP
jgi:hypothetical protein